MNKPTLFGESSLDLSEELRLLNRYTTASVGFAQQHVEPKDYRIPKSNTVKQPHTKPRSEQTGKVKPQGRTGSIPGTVLTLAYIT